MALEEISSDLQLSGVWIRQRGNPYLENLGDHTKYKVPLKGGGALENIAISPNGELLAYMDRYVESSGRGTDKWDFLVLKPDGHLIVLPNWVFDVRGILGWASNREIALKIYEKELKYIVYNVFSGEWREIPFDPKIFNGRKNDDLMSPFGEGSYFNPNQILFETTNGSILYNIQPWKKLLDFDLGYGADFSWSPDLSSIIINTYIDGEKNTLHVVKDNKDILQLNADKTGLATHDHEWIEGKSWSPNSRKFVVSSSSKLAVMDLEKLKLNRICIQNDPEFELSYMSPYVWSPDSQFLVVHYTKYNPGSEYEYYDILIDTETMHAFKVPSPNRNDDLLGWLASP